MAHDDEIARRFAACAVPTINAVMAKAGLCSNRMRHLDPVGPARRFVGRAATLRAIPTRADLKQRVAAGELPDLQARAFSEIAKGQVLVIEARGDLRASVFGDIMATYAMVRGAAAIVIDGCVSDREAIAGLDLPVFARGNAATSASLFLHFEEMGGAIGCDDVAVLPGDWLIGDGDAAAIRVIQSCRCGSPPTRSGSFVRNAAVGCSGNSATVPAARARCGASSSLAPAWPRKRSSRCS